MWIVSALFLAMAMIAAWRVVSLRDLAIDRERTRLQEFVEESVSEWETSLLKGLEESLETAASDPERVAARQHAWRRQRWFDSLYLWIPPGDKTGGRMVFPQVSTPQESLELRQSPCLQQAARLTMAGVESYDPLVHALVAGCRNEDLTVRLTASTSAANLLLSAHRYDEALRALEAARVPEALSVRGGASAGVSPFRLTSWQTLRVKLLMSLDRTDEALDLAVKVGDQVSELEAADLSAVTLHMRDLLSTLHRAGRTEDAARLDARFRRVDRRVYAYAEVNRKLLQENVNPEHPPDPRFVYDMYADEPFLLYYGWSNGFGVALGLEQDPLIEDFLDNRMRTLQGAITITEARTDRWVAGARSGGRYIIGVPFTRTLTHLRVNVRANVLDAMVASMHEQWLVPLAVIGLCVVIGIGALVAVDRAARQEYELLDRQRAFGTRVTHELKTPLAGIKVMAENLESGAFRDEAHRKEMARRIVAETDQLTKRVDEVLSVAKERSIPSPEPFDPEEILLIAIDEWGPRMQDAGVVLKAELAATDPIRGDGNALKDAVVCLLDNALKYRKEDRDDNQVWLDLSQQGGTIAITVTDNGIGVPKAMRKRIFDRFARVEGPNRGKAGGHGLGLHQVREIVTAHHGTVTCGEGVDGGAEFVIRVPALRSGGV